MKKLTFTLCLSLFASVLVLSSLSTLMAKEMNSSNSKHNIFTVGATWENFYSSGLFANYAGTSLLDKVMLAPLPICNTT